MTVRAKFRVESKKQHTSGFEVMLYPVTSGSDENKKFYQYTPSGSMTIGTINEEAAARFIVGREYYIDFTPADPS